MDEAESATTDNRPEFQDMIRQCRDNAQCVDCVLVWKLSRFARNRINSVVLKEVLELVFSRHNLEKYSEMIADSVNEEKKELEALVSRYRKEKEALAKKKPVYFDGLESGKLEASLVGERLNQLKDEEEVVSIKYLEAEERLSSLAIPEQRRLTDKEYEELKQSLKSSVEESTASQKKAFLSRFIKSVTVHPDKLTVECHPPYFTNTKSPSLEGEGFSVIGVASQRFLIAQRLGPIFNHQNHFNPAGPHFLKNEDPVVSWPPKISP